MALPTAAGLASFQLGRKGGYLLTASSFTSLAIILTGTGVFLQGLSYTAGEFVWWQLLSGPVTFGLFLDPMSILMGAIVAMISSLVFAYSIGYMHEEEGQPRFWFFMGCFESSMLLLVFSDNLIMSLIGWEGVGLCSFFLIGHYYRDQRDRWLGGPEGKAPFVKPSICSLKALLTTGLADSLMLIGIMLIYALYGTFSFRELEALAPVANVDPLLLLVASVLILMGPLGKSAQFPFHEWLPEAMSGPTPVSALLHSATMVKAGVYLVARLSPFFYALALVSPVSSGSFFLIAAVAGLITAIIGSLYGAISYEMKKVLAYSTVSQLGFMMVALGIAGMSGNPLLGLGAALFHLLSHSIFKASLFLGAGSAIHASHTPYLTEMGGLRKAAPKTFVAMALSALSLAGLPPLMGFWSKDAILAAVYPVNLLVVCLLAIASSLTAFYSIRLIWHAFFAPSTYVNRVVDEKALIVVPPLILSGLTVALGIFGTLIDETIAESLHASLGLSLGHGEGTLAALAFTAFALTAGIGSAYLLYFSRSRPFVAASSSFSALRSSLMTRPIDRVYRGLAESLLKASRAAYWFESLLNRGSIALASKTLKAASTLSSFHAGDLNRYLAVAGVLLLMFLLLMLVAGVL
jgi:proton-translocating NADH-quinone oxidoreductase chain L